MKHVKKTASWTAAAIIILAGLAYTAYDIHRHGLFDPDQMPAGVKSESMTVFKNTIVRESKYPCRINQHAAWREAQRYVKMRLAAPSTAVFSSRPWSGEDMLASDLLDDCSYHFTAFVDSQNAFGAMLRTRFSIIVGLSYNNEPAVKELRILD